jgi:hypothetical protein
MRNTVTRLVKVGMAWSLVTLVHLALSLATWISQDSVIFEAPVRLPLAWPWPVTGFPVFTVAVGVLGLRGLNWIQMLGLHALNSALWGWVWCMIRFRTRGHS